MTVLGMRNNGDKVDLIVAEGMSLTCSKEDILQVKDYQSGKILFSANSDQEKSTYVAKLTNGSTLVAESYCADKNNIVLTIQDNNVVRLLPANVLELKEVNTGSIVYPPATNLEKCP